MLLDTCAAVWLLNGDPMSGESLKAIREAAIRGGVLVSPVSAWEAGLLAARGVVFRPSPHAWFESLLGLAGVRLAPLSPRAAIESSFLPGRMHGDPADRMLAATARELGARLVTRDKRLLAYARLGHLAAVAC